VIFEGSQIETENTSLVDLAVPRLSSDVLLQFSVKNSLLNVSLPLTFEKQAQFNRYLEISHNLKATATGRN